MDRAHFDALTRQLVATPSRRRLLAALLGAALLGWEPDPALAGCRGKEGKNKRQCRRKQRRDDGAGDPGGAGCTSLDQVCGLGGPACCAPTTCEPTAAVVVATCQTSCRSDQDCFDKLGTHDVECVVDLLACPGYSGGCCRPKVCRVSSDCPTNRKCCPQVTGIRCCLANQKCVAIKGCVDR